MPRKANDVKSEWRGWAEREFKNMRVKCMSERTRVREGKRKGDRKGARARDNKSMLKPIITGLAISGDTNLRWPPFLRISLVSFSEAGRDTSLRRPIAIATFTGFQTDVGRNLFVIRISGTSSTLFTSGEQTRESRSTSKGPVHGSEVLFTYQFQHFRF